MSLNSDIVKYKQLLHNAFTVNTICKSCLYFIISKKILFHFQFLLLLLSCNNGIISSENLNKKHPLPVLQNNTLSWVSSPCKRKHVLFTHSTSIDFFPFILTSLLGFCLFFTPFLLFLFYTFRPLSLFKLLHRCILVSVCWSACQSVIFLSLFLSLSLLPPHWPSGKVSASRAEDPRVESRLRRDLFGVESCQWQNLALQWLPC